MAKLINNTGYQKKGTAQYSAGFQSGGTYINNDPIAVYFNEFYNDSENITKLSITQIRLKAGKKYKLTANMSGSLTENTYVWFRFYNVTEATYIGNYIMATNTADSSYNLRAPLGGGYFVPTVDSTVELRLASIGSGTYADYSSIVQIEEVEALLSETLGRTRFTENVTFDGYTKLGSDSPAIKCKKITGTTASEQGGVSSIAHGLDVNKIISVHVMVNHIGSSWISDTGHAIGYYFYHSTDDDNVNIINKSGDSENILSSSLVITILYEE